MAAENDGGGPSNAHLDIRNTIYGAANIYGEMFEVEESDEEEKDEDDTLAYNLVAYRRLMDDGGSYSGVFIGMVDNTVEVFLFPSPLRRGSPVPSLTLTHLLDIFP